MPATTLPPTERARLTRRIMRMRAHLALLRKRVPLAERLLNGSEHAALATTAAILAWLPTQALGLREGFWAAITALGVVQTQFGQTRSTGRDQFTGAAVGGMIGVGVALAFGQHLWGYAIAVVAAVIACWIANVASAARLAGITTTIILLVPHTGSPQHMLLSRIGEVGWGVIVALAVVWSGTQLRRLVLPARKRDGARP